MKPIRKIASGLDVGPLREALAAHPQLWDQNTLRTSDPASPHHGLSDIWARFAEPGAAGGDPHDSAWYAAADDLPIRELIYPLMSALQGDRLGGVLITRIPPGAQCRPHVDPGWHASYYEKFGIQVQADPRQAFCFESAHLVTEPGDLFWFDNAHLHWVTNDSDVDRVTVIACIRTDLYRGSRR